MIEFTIKTLESINHHFAVEDETTVAQLKERIRDEMGIEIAMQRLIFCGRVLTDELSLSECDLHGKVIHLVPRPPPRSPRNRIVHQTPRQEMLVVTGTAQSIFDRMFNQPNRQAFTRNIQTLDTPSDLVLEQRQAMRMSPTSNRLEFLRRLLDDIRVSLNDLFNHSLHDMPGDENGQWSESMETDTLLNTETPPTEETSNRTPGDKPVSETASTDKTQTDTSSTERNSMKTALPEKSPTETVSNKKLTTKKSPKEKLTSEKSPNETSFTETPSTRPEADDLGDDYPFAGARPFAPPLRRSQLMTRPNLHRPRDLAQLVEELDQLHDEFAPFRADYLNILRDTTPSLPHNLRFHREIMVELVCDVMHSFAHAYHAISDISIEIGERYPRLTTGFVIIQDDQPVQAHVNTNRTRRRSNENPRPSVYSPLIAAYRARRAAATARHTPVRNAHAANADFGDAAAGASSPDDSDDSPFRSNRDIENILRILSSADSEIQVVMSMEEEFSIGNEHGNPSSNPVVNPPAIVPTANLSGNASTPRVTMESGQRTSIGNNAGSNIAPGTGSNTVTSTRTNARTDTGTNGGNENNAGTVTGTNAGAGTGTKSGTGTGLNSGTGSGPQTGSGAGPNQRTGAGAGTGTTGTASGGLNPGQGTWTNIPVYVPEQWTYEGAVIAPTRVTHWATYGPEVGLNFGSRFAIALGTRPTTGPGTGTGAGPGTFNVPVSGTGNDTGRAPGHGTAPASVPETRPGTNPGDGLSSGPQPSNIPPFRPGNSFGPASGHGPGPASGHGPGPGSGHGPGTASGRSPGPASGHGRGPAFGHGPGLASGHGPGAASGPGAGPRSGPMPIFWTGHGPIPAYVPSTGLSSAPRSINTSSLRTGPSGELPSPTIIASRHSAPYFNSGMSGNDSAHGYGRAGAPTFTIGPGNTRSGSTNRPLQLDRGVSMPSFTPASNNTSNDSWDNVNTANVSGRTSDGSWGIGSSAARQDRPGPAMGRARNLQQSEQRRRTAERLHTTHDNSAQRGRQNVNNEREHNLALASMVYDRFLNCDSVHAFTRLLERRATFEDRYIEQIRRRNARPTAPDIDRLEERNFHFTTRHMAIMMRLLSGPVSVEGRLNAFMVTVARVLFFEPSSRPTTYEPLCMPREFLFVRIQMRDYVQRVLGMAVTHCSLRNTIHCFTDIVVMENRDFLERMAEYTELDDNGDPIIELRRWLYNRLPAIIACVMSDCSSDEFVACFYASFARFFTDLCALFLPFCIHGFGGLRVLYMAFIEHVTANFEPTSREWVRLLSRENLIAIQTTLEDQITSDILPYARNDGNARRACCLYEVGLRPDCSRPRQIRRRQLPHICQYHQRRLLPVTTPPLLPSRNDPSVNTFEPSPSMSIPNVSSSSEDLESLRLPEALDREAEDSDIPQSPLPGDLRESRNDSGSSTSYNMSPRSPVQTWSAAASPRHDTPLVTTQQNVQNIQAEASGTRQSVSAPSSPNPLSEFVPPVMILEHWGEEWVPVFTRDQRAQQEHDRPQEPFSDAYLSGMPSRKRRCVRASRPPTTLEGFMNESTREAMDQAASLDPAHVRDAFCETVRSIVRARALNSEDYDPLRYSSTARFINDAKQEIKESEPKSEN